MVIAYSTSPGKTAKDGKGRNSPFTASLLKQIETPGLESFQMLRNAFSNVEERTNHSQKPYFEGRPPKESFYFKPGKTPDEIMWGKVKNSKSPDVLNWFIQNYPGSRFADTAREQIGFLTADSGKTEIITIDPVSRETKIKITSNVNNAEVKIGGISYGRVPVEFIINQQGRYQIQVTASGFQPYDDYLKLSLGESRTINIDLEKEIIQVQTQTMPKETLPGMKFVYIKPGTFMMGSPKGEDGRDSDETQHKVTLTKGFFMQTTEVTVGQWRAFVKAKSYKSEAETDGGAYIWTGEKWEKKAGSYWDNPGFSQKDTQPVTCISWNDTQEFIKWLSSRDGVTYSLPTEAQWEYAARAGVSAARFWGENPDDACIYSNVADKTAKSKYSDGTFHNCDDGFVHTAPVGRFKPNQFGLYDMIGNVWEWCQDSADWDGKVVTDTYKDGITDPLCKKGSGRVIRGGSWGNYARSCRSAYRSYSTPGSRSVNLGFRLLRQP